MAAINEPRGVFLINGQALTLDVRSKTAVFIGSFVIFDPGQAETVVNRLHRFRHVTVLVGIFDAQDESTAIFFGDQVSIKRSAQVSNVHVAGRAGGKTSSEHSHFHWLIVAKSYHKGDGTT